LSLILTCTSKTFWLHLVGFLVDAQPTFLDDTGTGDGTGAGSGTGDGAGAGTGSGTGADDGAATGGVVVVAAGCCVGFLKPCTAP
jgi:hypothetical protein